MLRRRTGLLLTLCAIAAASSIVVPAAAAGEKFDTSIAISKAARRVDIVGLKLGMTVDEVRQAIERHDARLMSNLKADEATLRRADGTEQSFTWRLRTQRYGDEGDSIEVAFTNPPRETQSVGITRSRLFPAKDREPYADVRKVLLDRYGPPTEEARIGAKPGKKVDLDGGRGGIELKWRLDKGKAECLTLEIGRRAPRPKSLGDHKPKECSALLAAWISVDSGKVSRLTTTLAAPGLAAATQAEYLALVQAERKKASASKKDTKRQSL